MVTAAAVPHQCICCICWYLLLWIYLQCFCCAADVVMLMRCCCVVPSVLEGKLTEARSKKDTLKARAASAKTSRQVQEMIGSLNTSNAVVAFDKMEEKVRRYWQALTMERGWGILLDWNGPLVGLVGMNLMLHNYMWLSLASGCRWPNCQPVNCCVS